MAEQAVDPEHAFELLTDARARGNRLIDPYVWLEVHILDALSPLGDRYGHPSTEDWVDGMNELAARTGMRELTVRSLLHQARLGRDSAEETARLLATDIDNPRLCALLPAVTGSV